MANDLIPNFAEAYAQAFQTGRQMALDKGRQNALSMVSTDPSAAQTELMRYGDFQGANALGQNIAQQRTLKTQAAVAPQIQSGDYAGAAKTAAAGGEFDMAKQIGGLDAQQREAAQAHADIIARAAFGLSQKPAAERPALYEQIKPHLLQMGFKPEELANVDLSDQGLSQLAGQAMSVKEQIASHQKDTELQQQGEHNKATEDQAKATLAQTAEYHKAELGMRGQELSIQRQNADRAGWQVLTDPKTGETYRYNTASGKATTMDGSAPYSPQGAQKIGSDTNPRSATAMAMKEFKTENPNATSEDLARFNAHIGSLAKSQKDFATGKQGQTVNSLNVAVQHLDQLGQLADALKNNDLPAINKIGQAWTTQTGGAAPTNFNAAKQIVADEIVKAVVGSGGGVGDREQASKAVLSTNSPAQLRGVIQTYKGLMAGQLNGLRLQYKNSTGLDDFEQHLAPSTRAELETHANASASRPPLSSIFGR